MALWTVFLWLVLGAMFSHSGPDPSQEPSGSIRGVVTDKEFGIPLAGATVTIVEAGKKATTTDQGNFVVAAVMKFLGRISRDRFQQRQPAARVADQHHFA